MSHYALDLTATGAVISRHEDDGEVVALCEFTASTCACQRPSARVAAARSWFARYYSGAVPPAREHVPRGVQTRRGVTPWAVAAAVAGG